MTSEEQRRTQRNNLQFRYNMTPEQFKVLCDKYQGRCWICLRRPKLKQVDHDHACCPDRRSCGKCVRGILCTTCNNKLLGQVCQETKRGKAHAIMVLERGIRYLNGEL